MTAPVIAARRFLAGFLAGVFLGIFYDCLRPMRPRHTTLSDFLFLPAAVWTWMYVMFAVCRADLRLSAFAAMIAGCVAWEGSVSIYLRPVFSGIWKIEAKILDFLLMPVKKICQITKILFASWKKWVTIKWYNRRKKRRKSGGVQHGPATESCP